LSKKKIIEKDLEKLRKKVWLGEVIWERSVVLKRRRDERK
jgi:hypothetical protein